MAGVVDQKARSRTLFSDDAAGESEAIELELSVVDRDTIEELSIYPAGEDRQRFALNALRIGVLALRQARGRVDADLIRQETQRMLGGLEKQLAAHSSQMNQQLAGSLKEYFDPASGRFHERVQQLVKPDGELEQLLHRQIGSQDSELCKTLVGHFGHPFQAVIVSAGKRMFWSDSRRFAVTCWKTAVQKPRETRCYHKTQRCDSLKGMGHFGQHSPLMKLLNPSESEGLLQALRQTVETQLMAQRTHVLREFSLDNKEGALARMVGELTNSHGQLNEALQKKLDAVIGEFSLDQESSALSRLVRNVEGAQSTITREFSLDDETSAISRLAAILRTTRDAIDSHLTLDGENSALARLRGELLSILKTHSETNTAFQEDVKVALGKMVARREESQRSTQHGLVFEDAVCQYLEYHAQQTGDIASRTGQNTGQIKNNKVGDCVVELGPESAAPGAKIVVEAKESADYSLAKAHGEIETARKNRDAQVGLFIFSRRTAPTGMDEVLRTGHDVFVVWDPDDANTNLHLKIGLTLARALCIRVGQQSQSQAADIEEIGKAVLEIEKQSQSLSDVTRSAETIKSGAEKVLDRVRITRKSLERQVEILQAYVDGLRRSSGARDSGV